MFTAIVLTRALVNFTYGGRKVSTLSIGGINKRDANDSGLIAEEAK
jgi:hypothetical protein